MASNLSVHTIIKDSLMLLGEASVAESPSSEAALLGSRILNDLLLEWSVNEQINPTLKSVTITSAAHANYVTFGASLSSTDIQDDIMDVVGVQTLLGNIVYDLDQIGYAEYMTLSLKTQPAMPNYYACDYQYPEGKIYFHMAPLTSLNVQITYRPKFPEITTPSMELSGVDPIYRQAMVYNLASRLTPFYAPAAGMDQTIVYHAKNSLEKLKDRSRKMNTIKARPQSTGSRKVSGFWNSPLNTIGGR